MGTLVRTAADVLKYRNTINAQVPISDYYSGQTAQALQQVWGSSSLPRSTLLKPYPFWSSLNAKQTYDGTNIYHALQVRLDKHYSQGLYFTVVYTFSKNITNAFTGQMVNMVIDPIHLGPRTGFVGGLTGAFRNSARGYRQYQDPDNANADRALAFNDTPQMLTTASTYQLPFGYGRSFLNRKGPINFLLGGWHLTGIFNATSGVPLSISGPCNAITCRPNLVGNPKAVDGGQNAAHWIKIRPSGPILIRRMTDGGSLGMQVQGCQAFVRQGFGTLMLPLANSSRYQKASTSTSVGRCSTP